MHVYNVHNSRTKYRYFYSYKYYGKALTIVLKSSGENLIFPICDCCWRRYFAQDVILRDITNVISCRPEDIFGISPT